jgi:diguanylate cyclase (GGDEF)-like protein
MRLAEPRRDLETELGQGTARLRDALLADITHLLVSESAPERVLQAVAEALAELIPYDSLAIYRADPPLSLLRPELVRDTHAEEILAMGPLPYGQGITGYAALHREPQLVNMVQDDPRAEQIPGTPEEEEEAMIAVPLLARQELKGVLAIYRLGAGHQFAPAEFALAIRFADLAALTIDNADIRARLANEASTDHLTALFNHRYFHERLGEELRRASRRKSRVGLLIFDIDDFKRVNDMYGHLAGDQVLQGVASLAREACRAEDITCRIGGEEFAVVLPGCSVRRATAVAERLRRAVAGATFPFVGRITLSVGVAEGPRHASSPRELIACADLALLEAKAEGKDRVCVYRSKGRRTGTLPYGPGARSSEAASSRARHPSAAATGNEQSGVGARLAALASRGEPRLAAHLRLLASMSARLNKLSRASEIGDVIASELRSLIDYHSCRVYLLDADGTTLQPIAFLGHLLVYEGETYDALVMRVGEGITGHVAESGRSHYAPEANIDPFAQTIPGTEDIDESILAVPMHYGERVIGVIVLSKLGIDQFDGEDLQLLEVLAANAAVAFENARLFQRERESAEVSLALLSLSQGLTRVHDPGAVLGLALEAVPLMMRCGETAAWIRRGDGRLALAVDVRAAPRSDDSVPAPPPASAAARVLDAVVADRFLAGDGGPFVLPRSSVAELPPSERLFDDPREWLVAPLRWEPDGLAAMCILAPGPEASFGQREVELARGIADITSLALGNATRFQELERAYVSTVEALANAVEAKDEYTGNHCRALAELSMAVGSQMGLDPDRLKVLELGALFHDIGKIGVRSEIIRKAGPLTREERGEMRLHPEIGSQILAPVPFLQAIRPIVMASHERWDGKGYPQGLAGEDIPLESRIVFVCDAFHAMTTDRPYRRALPDREAIRRLRLSAGTQFDPAVVEVFARVFEAGQAVHTH